ncbi:MAG: DUF4293 domain-containing protein [Salibacteraceae bacterium]
MLQRIQSLYILLALICLGIGLVLPWSSYAVNGAEYVLTGASSNVSGVSHLPLTFALIVGIVLMIVTVILFRNRAQQMRLINITWVQIIVIVGMFALVHYRDIEALTLNGVDPELNYGLAPVLPLVAAILLWMAKRAIKKDEDLVKSVDRLR